MSTTAYKRTPAAQPAAERPALHLRLVSPSLLRTGKVEQATDLGNGYVIVKVDSTQHRQDGADQLPAIPDDDLRHLMALFADAPLASPAPAGPAARHEPEDNAQLLSGLDSNAMARRRQLHEAGQLLSSADLCERLHITRQALSKAVRDKRMFWIDGPAGVQWYPSFFATEHIQRRDIGRVSVALGDLPGPAKWQFFTTPKHSLNGKTPLAALESGMAGQVLRTAAETRERSLGR